MSLPVLYLSGTPYKQGLQHGQRLKDRIAHNVQVYFERFESEVGLSRAEVLARAITYGDAIALQNPEYFAGIEGVADGSGFDVAIYTLVDVDKNDWIDAPVRVDSENCGEVAGRRALRHSGGRHRSRARWSRVPAHRRSR